MNKKTDNKGFSLVELIIVIAIMAILVGVLAPQFIKYVESSRQSTDMQNASEIKATIEAYVAENNVASSTSITVGVNAAQDKLVVSDGSAVDETKGVYKALKDVGLSYETTLRSGGWPASSTAGTYSCSTYKWTPGTCTNGKEPAKKLEDVFK